MQYQPIDINYSALLAAILAHGLIIRIAFIFPVFQVFVGALILFEVCLTLMYFHESKSPISLGLLAALTFILVIGA